MSLTLTIPKEYAGVIAVTALTPALMAWQILQVSRKRKAAKIPYPSTFATEEQVKANPKAAEFNGAQRAHYNTIESAIAVTPSLLIMGLRFPLVATALGLFWLNARVFYTLGYLTGDPKKRNASIFAKGGSVAGIAILGGSLFTAGELVLKAFF